MVHLPPTHSSDISFNDNEFWRMSTPGKPLSELGMYYQSNIGSQRFTEERLGADAGLCNSWLNKSKKHTPRKIIQLVYWAVSLFFVALPDSVIWTNIWLLAPFSAFREPSYSHLVQHRRCKDSYKRDVTLKMNGRALLETADWRSLSLCGL